MLYESLLWALPWCHFILNTQFMEPINYTVYIFHTQWWITLPGEFQDCPPKNCPLGDNSEVGNPLGLSANSSTDAKEVERVFWKNFCFIVLFIFGEGGGDLRQHQHCFLLRRSSDCSYTLVIVYLGAKGRSVYNVIHYIYTHMLHVHICAMQYIGRQWCSIQSSIGLLLGLQQTRVRCTVSSIALNCSVFQIAFGTSASLQCTWEEGGKLGGVLWELLSCLSLSLYSWRWVGDKYSV